MWTLVQIAIYCGLAWIMLDLTRYFAGREAAWVVGLVILIVAVIFIFKQRKKIGLRRIP
jgi:hypothetical protein